MVRVGEFKEHLLGSGYVLDPEGMHHEFANGMHGRKLNFDNIASDDDLYSEWVEANAQKIDSLYSDKLLGQTMLVGVANGTNRLVHSIAELMDTKITAVETQKVTSKTVELTEEARSQIRLIRPELFIVVEDVGTSGSTAASAVRSIRNLQLDRPRIEAVNTWQRRPSLPELIGATTVYYSIIYEPLPTLKPEDCQNTGYCAQGWNLIAR